MTYREELIERIKVANYALRFNKQNSLTLAYNRGKLSAYKKALEIYDDDKHDSQ